MAFGSAQQETSGFRADGRWAGRLLRGGLIVLLALGLAWGCFVTQFRGLNSSESMELGHLARQLADGHGFTTLHIRPFAAWLLHEKGGDAAQLRLRQPELKQPPLYAAMLMGIFKIARFDEELDGTDAAAVFTPERWMCWIAEFWLLLAILIFYRTIRRLADRRVCWLSIGLLLLSGPLWREAVSGSSTTFLLFLFGVICYATVRFHEMPEENRAFWWIGLAAAAIGAGCLVRYRFVILLLPLITQTLVLGRRRAAPLALLALLITLGIAEPWILRNLRVSGLPFGSATYAIMEGSDAFPGDSLEKEIAPRLEKFTGRSLGRKYLDGLRAFLREKIRMIRDHPLPFILIAGLFCALQPPRQRRLRNFALNTGGWLFVIFPLIWNPDSFHASGNLFILLLPLVFFFGAILFWDLLDRLPHGTTTLRGGLAAGLVCLNATAFLVDCLAPQPPARPRFSRYEPSMIYSVSRWMRPGEVMMSDIPWAVAWYGNTPCMTLVGGLMEFERINKESRPIAAIYFTPRTLDRGLTDGTRSGKLNPWAPLLASHQPPENFPLRVIADHLPHGFLFITDRVRWRTGGG